MSTHKWIYTGKSSDGTPKFKKETGESLEFVTKFLDEKGVVYETRDIPPMLWIYNTLNEKIQYFYTTGRWGVANGGRRLPTKHYHSNGIVDLYDKVINKEVLTEPDHYFNSEVVDVLDVNCGKRIAWGRKIKSGVCIPDPIMNGFKENLDLEYFDGEGWVLVNGRVSVDELVELYGDITDVQYGSKGGWKSITFGETEFTYRKLRFLHKEAI